MGDVEYSNEVQKQLLKSREMEREVPVKEGETNSNAIAIEEEGDCGPRDEEMSDENKEDSGNISIDDQLENTLLYFLSNYSQNTPPIGNDTEDNFTLNGYSFNPSADQDKTRTLNETNSTNTIPNSFNTNLMDTSTSTKRSIIGELSPKKKS
eukprot:TRINITY_DN782_c0_g1_i14.p1 TRINITY_DN782_c0_g1~~TRINITY_DN782_c0_g1_i14.p1  ORF type:complete len:152 (+),score=37.21 TRINITY_DN782_c0_g1_i14:946-1401(+)